MQLWSHIDNVSTTVLTPTILQNLSTMSSKTTILESMKKPFVWGTQLELQAASDYYKMCIYLLTKREQEERYHWHRYTPRTSAVAADNLRHIELAHPRSVHFDPILDAATLQSPKRRVRHERNLVHRRQKSKLKSRNPEIHCQIQKSNLKSRNPF